MAPTCSGRSLRWWPRRWEPTCTGASSATSLSVAEASCARGASATSMPGRRKASAGRLPRSASPSGTAGAESTG
eukprot:6785343-Alexandrium_andersonii.AAC.1